MIFMINMLLFNFDAYASGPISFPDNLDGIYDCHSTIDKNKKDHGTVILKKSGQTYSIKSHFDDGSDYIGTGIYNRTKHSFAVVFANTKNPEKVSLGISNVKANFTMTSSWTFINSRNIYNSICTKVTESKGHLY
jgi:hypothetical protein